MTTGLAVHRLCHNVVPTPCQGGGFLGTAYDPFQVTVDPETRTYRADLLRAPPGASTFPYAARLAERRGLLNEMERGPDLSAHASQMRAHYDKAYALFDSPAIRRALEIDREDPRLRDRYGFGPPPAGSGGGLGSARRVRSRGQNLLLLARRPEVRSRGFTFVNSV